ncbi:hypothetical protein EVAR_56202_1 [Eumeta japonica]|uniref:Uncharacterized protein n=1 Tax=Eumeta variegata TaxID=151549 RepID=A0A4C1Y5B9_EUMVA|nr:hypothetical protein EVAR_56202_1 [Eumeta japonica]
MQRTYMCSGNDNASTHCQLKYEPTRPVIIFSYRRNQEIDFGDNCALDVEEVSRARVSAESPSNRIHTQNHNRRQAARPWVTTRTPGVRDPKTSIPPTAASLYSYTPTATDIVVDRGRLCSGPLCGPAREP